MRLWSGILLASGAALIACAPVIDQRGYLPDPQLEAGIKTGADTKTSVQDKLGNAFHHCHPSAAISWYYISSTEKQGFLFSPRHRAETGKFFAIAISASGRRQSDRDAPFRVPQG